MPQPIQQDHPKSMEGEGQETRAGFTSQAGLYSFLKLRSGFIAEGEHQDVVGRNAALLDEILDPPNESFGFSSAGSGVDQNGGVAHGGSALLFRRGHLLGVLRRMSCCVSDNVVVKTFRKLLANQRWGRAEIRGKARHSSGGLGSPAGKQFARRANKLGGEGAGFGFLFRPWAVAGKGGSATI